jgi:hypothetical protein
VDHLGDLISTVLQTAAAELPREGMVAVWIALVVGLVIWFRGRKMAKFAFSLFGAVTLGFVGYLAVDSLVSHDSAWMGGIAGLIVGAILGGLLLRFTVAIALALVLALIVPMLTATALQKWGAPPGLREQAHHAADSARTLLLDGVPEVPALPIAQDKAIDALKSADTDSDATDGVERARAFLARLGEELKPVWDEVPEDDRILLAASSLVGAGFGVAIGMLFHRKATALVTAGVGAALWLPAAAVAYRSFPDLPQPEVPTWPGLWAGVWAGTTLLGVILQSRGKNRSSDSKRDEKDSAKG